MESTIWGKINECDGAVYSPGANCSMNECNEAVYSLGTMTAIEQWQPYYHACLFFFYSLLVRFSWTPNHATAIDLPVPSLPPTPCLLPPLDHIQDTQFVAVCFFKKWSAIVLCSTFSFSLFVQLASFGLTIMPLLLNSNWHCLWLPLIGTLSPLFFWM